MSIGQTVAKPILDELMGTNALNLLRELRKVDEIRAYLLATPDADLVAMGYTSGEVATFKSAYADVAHGHRVLLGLDTQTPAADLLVNLRLLAGALVT